MLTNRRGIGHNTNSISLVKKRLGDKENFGVTANCRLPLIVVRGKNFLRVGWHPTSRHQSSQALLLSYGTLEKLIQSVRRTLSLTSEGCHNSTICTSPWDFSWLTVTSWCVVWATPELARLSLCRAMSPLAKNLYGYQYGMVLACLIYAHQRRHFVRKIVQTDSHVHCWFENTVKDKYISLSRNH